MEHTFETNIRYRSVEEARILELLLLYGWAHDLRRGARVLAAREAGEALGCWVRLGLPYRLDGTQRFFDPAEVINFCKWAAIARGDPIWEKRLIATGRRLVLEQHDAEMPGNKPPAPAGLPPARFSFALSREFHLQNFAIGAPVHLRLPYPLDDATLQELRTEFVAPPGVDVEFSTAPGRLDARLAVPPDRKITLGLRATFTARPTKSGVGTARLRAGETGLYTRPREGLVQVSPRIRALAGELTHATADPRACVETFWSFLIERPICGVIHYDALDVTWPTDAPLETGWCDCQLGSALLVALCRAKGIPARLVSGYLLYPANPSEHYWAEVWVDGAWLPFDLFCSDLSARGRDPEWQKYFFGQLDYRLKTQCLPRLFNTIPSLRFPAAWYFLSRVEEGGIESAFFANESGAPIYRDHISVTRTG